MSEWFYSPAPGRQEGPLDDQQLARLQLDGTLRPETLVWREGMPAWLPWGEVMHAVAMENASLAEALANRPQAGRVEPTFATATAHDLGMTDMGMGEDRALDGPLPTLAATDSPYAPPQARVDETGSDVVRGGRVVYAGFWRRFAAYCIDYIITTTMSYTLMIPLVLFLGIGSMGMGSDNPFASAGGIVMLGVTYLLMILSPVLYFAWMHSSRLQASLGKMAVGIKVTRSNGERIGFWRAFGRVFAHILSALIAFIGYIMAGFTERKQALHDMVCDTLVVDKWAYTEHPEWQKDKLDVVTLVILCLVGLFALGMLALLVFAGIAGSLGNCRPGAARAVAAGRPRETPAALPCVQVPAPSHPSAGPPA